MRPSPSCGVGASSSRTKVCIGSGINSHYAARYPERLEGFVQLDPIAFDGYPVNEIQAIGRASMIPDTPEGDAMFAGAFGAFDQTLVQIYKTMVYDPNVYNQYNLRRITLNVYKLYAESFRGHDHLHQIQAEAQDLVAATFTRS